MTWLQYGPRLRDTESFFPPVSTKSVVGVIHKQCLGNFQKKDLQDRRLVLAGFFLLSSTREHAKRINVVLRCFVFVFLG
ncbi:hypothetical protein CCR75_007420 [Bremia lactucae]|uniref:Uncharacterized protein n=1 Tax=Bremia lactucae TaxID=4779 RepID=A0A976NZ60_BRELC|nr:hypothetical protein CCR75_007420 [Bremia lactucae]